MENIKLKEGCEDLLKSLERLELSEEQQFLLSSFEGGKSINITFTSNNFVTGCGLANVNCRQGNCGNCVSGCGH